MLLNPFNYVKMAPSEEILPTGRKWGGITKLSNLYYQRLLKFLVVRSPIVGKATRLVS